MSNGLQYLRSQQILSIKDYLNDPIYEIQSLLNQICNDIAWEEENCPERGDYFEELTCLHRTLAMARSSIEIAAHLLDEAVSISEGGSRR